MNFYHLVSQLTHSENIKLSRIFRDLIEKNNQTGLRKIAGGRLSGKIWWRCRELNPGPKMSIANAYNHSPIWNCRREE